MYKIDHSAGSIYNHNLMESPTGVDGNGRGCFGLAAEPKPRSHRLPILDSIEYQANKNDAARKAEFIQASGTADVMFNRFPPKERVGLNPPGCSRCLGVGRLDAALLTPLRQGQKTLAQ